jgi:hypothetical protein
MLDGIHKSFFKRQPDAENIFVGGFYILQSLFKHVLNPSGFSGV